MMIVTSLIWLLSAVAVFSSPIHPFQDDSEETSFEMTNSVPILVPETPEHTLSSSLENDETLRKKRDIFWVFGPDTDLDTKPDSDEPIMYPPVEDEEPITEAEEDHWPQFSLFDDINENDVNQMFEDVPKVSAEPQVSEVADLNRSVDGGDSADGNVVPETRQVHIRNMADLFKLFMDDSDEDEPKTIENTIITKTSAVESAESNEHGPLGMLDELFPEPQQSRDIAHDVDEVPLLLAPGLSHPAPAYRYQPPDTSSLNVALASQQMPYYWHHESDGTDDTAMDTVRQLSETSAPTITVLVGNVKVQFSSAQPLQRQQTYPQFLYPYGYRLNPMAMPMAK